MKHFIRDIVVSLFSLLGIAFLYRFASRKPLVRVIAFHDVSDRVWFEEVISMITTHFHVVSPDAFHAGAFDSTKINILITFDDGYESWITTCLPVLDQHTVHALFFLNSGLIDVSSDTESVREYMHHNLRITPKQSLSWEMARMLVDHGHTLGGHTVHHKSLRNVSSEELHTEVVNDKHTLETRLGISLHDFAYPFGTSRDYSENTEHGIRKVGYTYLYTAEPGFVHTVSEHIPRTLLERNQSLVQIAQWIRGGYDLFFRIRKKVVPLKPLN